MMGGDGWWWAAMTDGQVLTNAHVVSDAVACSAGGGVETPNVSAIMPADNKTGIFANLGGMHGSQWPNQGSGP